MEKQNVNNKRRELVTGTLGLGALSTVLPQSWSEPVIRSVVIPAHAQTSCPAIMIGPASLATGSGTMDPGVCAVTFNILSSDDQMPLTVVSVTTDPDPLPDNVEVEVEGIDEPATSTLGPIVRWQGPAGAALFCEDLNTPDGAPLDDIIFSITVTCESLPGQQFTQEFNLLDIIADGELDGDA